MTARSSPSGPAKIILNVVTFDVASIPTQTAPDSALTVPDALVGDGFIIAPTGTYAVGVTHPQGRCLVAGTVQARVANVTVGAVDVVSQDFNVYVVRA